MLKFLVVAAFAILSCQAFPRHHRLRREAQSAPKYGPCKNTYDQCPEWKGEGMCTSEQYKDYMMTVCPVTCEFCKESNGEESEAGVPSEPDESSKSQTGTAPKPAAYDASSNSPSDSIEKTSATADTNESSTESSQNVDQSNAAAAAPTAAANVGQTVNENISQQPASSNAIPNTQQTSEQTTQAADSNANVASRETVGSANVDAATKTEDDDYQSMLKKYYANVEEQQLEYQKTMAKSYPGYQNPSIDSTNSNAVVATSPQQPSTEQAPAQPAPAAPIIPAPAPGQPAPNPSQSSAPASLPENVPNPIAAATAGETSPAVFNTHKTEKLDPKKTSSALYKGKTTSKDTKLVNDSKFKNASKGTTNSTIGDSDDATNEKVKSESKHIEQTIKSAKEKRISAEKQLKTNSESENQKDKSVSTTKKLASLSSKNSDEKDTSSETESDDGDDGDEDEDDDQEEDLKGYESKRTNLTVPSVIDASSSLENTNVSVKSKISGSGSGDSSDDDAEDDDAGDEEEDKEDSSGSGGMGEIEDDLDELNMLMSLNFDDGYDQQQVDLTTADGDNRIDDEKLSDTSDNNNNNKLIDSRSSHDESKRKNTAAVVSGDNDDNEDDTESSENENNASGSASGTTEEGNSEQGSGQSEQSGDAETTGNKNIQQTSEKKVAVKNKISQPDDNAADSESGNSSGQSESEPEDEEEAVDEEGSARDEEALPLQEPTDNLKQSSKGSISLVLRQNFQGTYKNTKSPSYQMLSGNVKKDFENVLKKTKVSDVTFSEANIEGNPRQTGKTKVTFNLDSQTQHVMKALTKLVDSGSINGLSVISGSLEFNE